MRKAARWPLLSTIAVMVVLLAIALRWSTVRRPVFWVDLDVYVRGANAVLHGEDLYAVGVHGLLFTYPPFAAVIFAPLALVPVMVHRLLFTALSVVAYLAVLRIVGVRLGLSKVTIGLVGLGAMALEPVARTIQLGQVNLILLAMVVIDLLVLPSKHRGYLTGMAAGIKLVPGIFLIYLILKRDWRSLRHSVIGLLTSIVIGGIWAPTATLQYWSGGLLTMGKFGESAVFAVDNQSASALLMRLFHAADLPTGLTLVGCLIGVTLGALGARRQLRRGNDVGAVLALGLGGLLGSPVSWSHHWVWVVVFMLVLARRRAWVTLWATGALFWIAPFWALDRGDFKELTLGWGGQVVGGVYVLAGLALLAVLWHGGATADAASAGCQEAPGQREGVLPGGEGRRRSLIMNPGRLSARPILEKPPMTTGTSQVRWHRALPGAGPPLGWTRVSRTSNGGPKPTLGWAPDTYGRDQSGPGVAGTVKQMEPPCVT